jgi:hypothetical protein
MQCLKELLYSSCCWMNNNKLLNSDWHTPGTLTACTNPATGTLERPTGGVMTSLQLCIQFHYQGTIEQHIFQLDNLWILHHYLVCLCVQLTQPDLGSRTNNATASYDLQGTIHTTPALSNLQVTLQLILSEPIDDIPPSPISDWSHLYQSHLQWNQTQSNQSTSDTCSILFKSIPPTAWDLSSGTSWPATTQPVITI